MQVLLVLTSNARQVVSREQLPDEVWPDTFSGDAALTRCISLLRSSFGQTRSERAYIETVSMSIEPDHVAAMSGLAVNYLRLSEYGDLSEAEAMALHAYRKADGAHAGADEIISALYAETQRARDAGISVTGRAHSLDFAEGISDYLSGSEEQAWRKSHWR